MSTPSLERIEKIKRYIKDKCYLTRGEFEILLEMISDYGSDEYQEGHNDAQRADQEGMKHG